MFYNIYEFALIQTFLALGMPGNYSILFGYYRKSRTCTMFAGPPEQYLAGVSFSSSLRKIVQCSSGPHTTHMFNKKTERKKKERDANNRSFVQ